MRLTYLLEGGVEADVSGNFASGRVVVPLTYSLRGVEPDVSSILAARDGV